MADETSVNVQDRQKKGKCHQGYFWSFYNPLNRCVFFAYHPTRSRQVLLSHLNGFQGCLQSDGFSVYQNLIDPKTKQPLPIQSAGCMAHARRHFEAAKGSDFKRVKWMLEHIGQLYDVEKKARKAQLEPQERQALRQEKSQPILDAIKEWIDHPDWTIVPKSKMAKAINYMKNNREQLTWYLNDGRIEIDNNWVENQIRPIALGRKNYLFCGSHKAAENAAAIYSLMATAKMYKVDPFTWLKDVFDRIADHPYKDIDQLLPQYWQPSK